MNQKQWTGWGIALGGAAFVVILATLPPLLGDAWRFGVMQAFHLVCHQIPERSPHWDGIPLAVCHRCYGVYWGLVAGVLAFLLIRRWDNQMMRYAGFVLLAAVAIPGIDWAGDVLDVWSNTPASRFITGGVFGVLAAYYLAHSFTSFGNRHTISQPA